MATTEIPTRLSIGGADMRSGAIETVDPEDSETQELVSKFLLVKSHYADRNVAVDSRDDMFEGNHWPSKENTTAEYRLVFNYSRRVVMGYVATFARAPKPRVPMPATAVEESSAAAREKLLLIVWGDLMRAWYDVELCASKVGYGVIQALWAPAVGQPETVDVSHGKEKATQKQYTENPFVFRSIPPKLFYPVYRTLTKPNDFLEAFRFDPQRILKDLEDTYKVKLDQTGSISPDGWSAVDTEPTCDVIEYWTAKEYILIAMTRVTYADTMGRKRNRTRTSDLYHVLKRGSNPYNVVPFWVLQNIRADSTQDPTNGGSMSDMEDIISLNQHYNHIMSEQAQEIVTNIHRPIVYSSDDHQQDPKGLTMAAGAVYPIGGEEELGPLQWDDQPNLVESHMERVKKAIQDLTFYGDAGFGAMPAGASGVALRIALTPMQQVIELKIPQRASVLQGVCKFILSTFEKKSAKDAALVGWLIDQYKRFGLLSILPSDIRRAYYVDIDYGNLLPRDDFAFEQNEVYKFKTGAQSLLTTIDHLGVEDPLSEVARIKQERQDPVLNPEAVMATRQIPPAMAPGGMPPGGQQPGAMPGMPGMPGMGQQDLSSMLFANAGAAGMGMGMQQPGMNAAGQPGMLPGTAQPGTAPLTQSPPPSRMTSPPVPNEANFNRSEYGAGAATPYMKR